MVTAPFRHESSGGTPNCPPPSRLWTLPMYVVYKPLSRIHHHLLYRPRSWILCRNCDGLRVTVCVSVPNVGINCPSHLLEEGPVLDCLLYRSLQTGVLADPPDAEPGDPVAPPPISTSDGSARDHTGPPACIVDGVEGSCHHLSNEHQ